MYKHVTAQILLAMVVGCSAPVEEPASDGIWGRASLVEEIRIGVEVGAEEYMLGSVEDVAVSSDGTIYVSDSSPRTVRVFDPQGDFLRHIGREGQGPDEYRYAPRLDMLSDDTLVVWAYGNQQVSLFSDQGEYVGGFSTSTRSPHVFVDTLDNICVRTTAELFRSGGDEWLVKYSRRGESLGRVDLPPEDINISGTFLLSAEGMISSFPIATRTAFSPFGYIVTGRNDRYDIELRDPEGTRHIGREVDPAVVQPEEWDEWEAFRQALVQQRARVPDRAYEVDPIPETKPYFREIHAGQDGRIWVFRYVAAQKRDDVEPLPDRPDRPLLTWREPWTYDVFEPDGTFLGSVVIPETFRPFVFGGDRIWGAIVGVDGVDRVLRLRVVPEG